MAEITELTEKIHNEETKQTETNGEMLRFTHPHPIAGVDEPEHPFVSVFASFVSSL